MGNGGSARRELVQAVLKVERLARLSGKRSEGRAVHLSDSQTSAKINY